MMRTLKSTLCGFLLIILLPALLSGCWERKELNELAFVLGYGLDKEGDQFKVTMQVVIPSEIATSTTAKGGGTPVTVYDFKVKTIYEALHEFTLASPGQVTWGISAYWCLARSWPGTASARCWMSF